MTQAEVAEQAPDQWEVPVDLIDPNPHQPRTDFDEDLLEELTRSIKAVGVLQPVLLRRAAGGRYELIAGERRWRASCAANLATIPATLRQVEDGSRRLLAFVENLHRKDLNPLEKAATYAQLIDEHNLTHADLAELVQVDRSQVTRSLALLRLPEGVQRRVASGVISQSHADLLTGLHDPGAIELLARRIVAEGLSVVSVREIIAVGGLPGSEELDGRAEMMRERRRRVAAPLPDDLREVAEGLGDRLETRVRVFAGKKRGRIVVDYVDREDLERILAAMGSPRA